VLADFPGTILLVSHDRYLIDALATQIWSLEDGRLDVFKGSWSEYAAYRQGDAPKDRDEEREKDGARGTRAPTAARAKAAERGRDSAQADYRQQKAEERKRATRLSELEAQITALEQRLAELVRDLEEAGSGADVGRVRTLGEEYAQVQADLETHLRDWEALAA
jgi:ATP-binding cassette subfamily F protein 3